jgi:hypothetical protein
VQDINYFAASMDFFHLALYNICFWVYLGWSLLCWSFSFFHLELFLWFHLATYNIGNPPLLGGASVLDARMGGVSLSVVLRAKPKLMLTSSPLNSGNNARNFCNFGVATFVQVTKWTK